MLDGEHLFGNTGRVPESVVAPPSSRERRAVQRTFDDMGTPLSDVTFCIIDFEFATILDDGTGRPVTLTP